MTTAIIQEIVRNIRAGNYKQALKLIDKHTATTKADQVLLQLKGEALRKSGNEKHSAQVYKQAALIGGKHSASSWYNAAVMFQKIGSINEAIQAYKNTIDLDPTHLSSRNNLCVLLYQQNRSEDALQHAKWIYTNSETAEHLVNAGYVLRGGGFYDEADVAFKRALEIDPDNWKMVSSTLQSAQYVCDWETVERLSRRIKSELYDTKKYILSRELHHVHLAWCDDELTNVEMAKAATERLTGQSVAKYSHIAHNFNKRIKVGYVSSDFFNHATLHLLIGVLEKQNKQNFELFAYCHSKNDNSVYRRRFLNSIDNYRDITKLTDDAAAELIYSDGIDVLFDLKGFTDKNRLAIFAKRPAPIQVTYIGFPGSSGADYFDYTITDKTITPDSSKEFYTEKLCRLPEVYQCNDNNRIIALNKMTRETYNLPEGKFVFCCFNQSYKIESVMFYAWVQILKLTTNTVLWILNPGENGLGRLRRIFEEEGLSIDRLVASEKEPPPIHLKRISEFADLALDTRIVNGHTTTSDALWAGVPVVTLYGKHFNSRVSASLISAVNLSELVTYTIEEYIALAVRLACNKDELEKLKTKLRTNRFIAPLFDTERFTQHFEIAIQMMVQNAINNRHDHIDVPALPARSEPFMQEIKLMEVNTKKNSRQPNFNQLTDYFVSNHVCPICYSEDIKPVRPSAIKLKIDEIDNEFAANWCLCSSCGHVFRERMLNTVGKSFALNPFDVPFTRVDSFRLLNKTASYINNNQDNSQIKNLFIYPQDITMFATGVEFGYSMSALVEPLRFDEYKKVSGSVLAGDLMTVNINGIPNAIHIGRYLERAQDALATLQRLSNILDIGGLLTLVFSNVGSYEWNLINKEKTCPIWDDPQSTQLYRRNLLIKSAKEHGFEYVRSVPIVDNIAGVFMILRKVK